MYMPYVLRRSMDAENGPRALPLQSLRSILSTYFLVGLMWDDGVVVVPLAHVVGLCGWLGGV
jgi:hypothetical protein